jgi:cell division protein ZapA
MAQVNVRISGRTYRMACDDGEEEHLTQLAERLDRSIEQLRARFGEIRLTVMAAITLADQQAESERRVLALQAEMAGMEEARVDLTERHRKQQYSVAEAIVSLAERVETITAHVAGVDVDAN